MSKQAPGPKELALRQLRENGAMETARDERERKRLNVTTGEPDHLRKTIEAIPAKKPRKAKAERKAKRA